MALDPRLALQQFIAAICAIGNDQSRLLVVAHYMMGTHRMKVAQSSSKNTALWHEFWQYCVVLTEA